MTHHCANCSGVIANGTGQPFDFAQGKQFGTVWLGNDCLAMLSKRGYLVGSDKTGGAGQVAITPLTFQRNGHLLTYLAPANYWQSFLLFRRMAPHVRAWLESLPDSELQPFKDHKGKEL